MPPGLLATLGLQPLQRSTGQLSADLHQVSASLRASCAEAHPGVPLDAARRLLERADALEQQLDADEHEASLPEAQAVAQLRRQMLAAEQLVIAQHKLAAAQAVRDALARCRQEAQEAGLAIDAQRWAAVEAALDVFEGLQVVAPPRVALAELDKLLAEVALARGLADTARQRLPLRPQDLAAHERLLPAQALQALAARMQPGVVSTEPGPLGFADPKYDRGGYPVVEVTGGDGVYRLKPTQASDPGLHTCRIQPIGEQLLGRIDHVDEDDGRIDVLAPDGSGFAYRLDAVSRGWKGKLLKRGLTPEAYREVEKRELEHLVDFAYAFRVAAEALAEAVNDVAQATYGTPRGPIQALVETLAAGPTIALIPSDPYDGEAWADRLTAVLTELSGQSDKRDKPPLKTHCPVGMTAEVAGDSVVIRPVFGTASLRTTDLIRLELAGTVFGGGIEEDDEPPPTTAAEPSAPQTAWTLRTDLRRGAVVTMRRTETPDVFGAVGNPDAEDGGLLQPGTPITLEEDPPTAEGTRGDTLVWASASLGALALKYPTSAGDIGYFQVPLAAFE